MTLKIKAKAHIIVPKTFMIWTPTTSLKSCLPLYTFLPNHICHFAIPQASKYIFILHLVIFFSSSTKISPNPLI